MEMTEGMAGLLEGEEAAAERRGGTHSPHSPTQPHLTMPVFLTLLFPGFSGSQCQVDADECASTPCKNGGKCTDGPNKYACECTEGMNTKRYHHTTSMPRHCGGSKATSNNNILYNSIKCVCADDVKCILTEYL